MIWATVSSRSCFCWLYRASPFSAAKNIINLVSVKCTCPWRSSSKAFFLYCLPPLPLQAPLESCTSLIVTLFVLSFFSSQHWAGALSLLCSSSCSRASRAPSNLLNTVWLKHEVWDLLLGHETTSFLKTQHNLCFPYGAGLDSILGLFMLSILSHLSNGLWTLCLVPMKTTAEG